MLGWSKEPYGFSTSQQVVVGFYYTRSLEAAFSWPYEIWYSFLVLPPCFLTYSLLDQKLLY